MAALQHFRRPEVTVIQHGADGTTSESAGDSEVKIHHSDDLEPKPLPLHHVPLTVTFGLMREPNTEGSARTVLELLLNCRSNLAVTVLELSSNCA